MKPPMPAEAGGDGPGPSPLAPVQVAAADAAARLWDVAIVGAGPAGSTAAMALAEQGHAVLLLERRGFPRDKACGDALIPDSLRVLRRLGLEGAVAPLGHPMDRVEIWSAGRVPFSIPGRFLTIRRASFDAALAAEAVRRGAVLCPGDVRSLTPEDGGVVARLGGADLGLRARIGILATCADVSLLEPLGLVSRRAPNATAARAYVRSTLPLDRLVVSYDRSILPGYAWIFPLGDGAFNLGCGVFHRGSRRPPANLRAMLRTFVRDFPLARDLLARGAMTGALRGARLRCGLTGASAHAGGPILAIGESIGTTFPFTGEGIGKAMETGLLAAACAGEALAADDPAPLAALPGLIRRDLAPRYRGYRTAERWLARPWLGDVLARRIRKSPRLQDSVAGILDETVDPKAVFSVRALVGSLAG